MDIDEEDLNTLKELEGLFGRNIPIVDNIQGNTFGVKIENGKVIGLGLYGNKQHILNEFREILEIPPLEFSEISLPDSIGNFSSLKKLYISSNALRRLPNSIGNIATLKELNLFGNQLTSLPKSIGDLSSLEILNIDFNQLERLPDSMDKLKSLKSLTLICNKLKSLPETFGELNSLERLTLTGNPIEKLPISFKNLASLERLEFSGVKGPMVENVQQVLNLESLKELFLMGNEMLEFPEITHKIGLERLYLGNNKISSLPNTFKNLTSLKNLSIFNNLFEKFPEILLELKNLKELCIGRNPFSKIIIKSISPPPYSPVIESASSIQDPELKKKLEFLI
ncbi:MAG: leucine-rich repeat domain-containing protein, partial [Promethearchaeota archaeon]